MRERWRSLLPDLASEATKTLPRKGHHVYATMRDVDGRNAHKAQELRDFPASEVVSILESMGLSELDGPQT